MLGTQLGLHKLNNIQFHDPTRTMADATFDIFSRLEHARDTLSGHAHAPSWARLKRAREAASEPLRAAGCKLYQPAPSGPKCPEVLRNAPARPFRPTLLDTGAAND